MKKTKLVNLIMYQVFVVADDAEVRKIVKSVHCVEDRLSVITAVKSMKHLVAAFKVCSVKYLPHITGIN